MNRYCFKGFYEKSNDPLFLEDYKKIKKIKSLLPIFSLETIFDIKKNISHIVSGHSGGSISFWSDESLYHSINKLKCLLKNSSKLLH